MKPTGNSPMAVCTHLLEHEKSDTNERQNILLLAFKIIIKVSKCIYFETFNEVYFSFKSFANVLTLLVKCAILCS